MNDSLTEGIFVRALQPGGAAHRSALISVGDVITAVNSMPLIMESRVHVEQAFASAGNTMELTITGYVTPDAVDALKETEAQGSDDNTTESIIAWTVSIMKTVVVFPFFVVLFLLSIIEGLYRVTAWRVLKTLTRSGNVSPRADPENFLFDMMMHIWFVLFTVEKVAARSFAAFQF